MAYIHLSYIILFKCEKWTNKIFKGNLPNSDDLGKLAKEKIVKSQKPKDKTIKKKWELLKEERNNE